MPFDTIEVSLIWMSSGYWKMVFSVEFQFLFDDTIWLFGDFTLYSPIEYIIWYVHNVVGEFVCGDDLCYFRKWGFIVTPVESLRYGLFFIKRIHYLAHGMIVSKWANF